MDDIRNKVGSPAELQEFLRNAQNGLAESAVEISEMMSHMLSGKVAYALVLFTKEGETALSCSNHVSLKVMAEILRRAAAECDQPSPDTQYGNFKYREDA